MPVLSLNDRPTVAENSPLSKLHAQFSQLLTEVANRDLPESVVQAINNQVAEINASPLAGNALKKLMKKKQTAVLSLLEKEAKLVPKNRYRNLWMVFGMTSFGLPIGVTIGLLAKNIGLLAIGLPFGMAIGLAVGSRMDKKALNEGRQLPMEIKY